MSPSTTLREFINRGDTITAPGVYDGISARLVEQAGFPAIYASAVCYTPLTLPPKREV